MKHPTLDQIKKDLIQLLTAKYGFCAVADAPARAMLTFGGDDDDFRIVIEDCSPRPSVPLVDSTGMKS